MLTVSILLCLANLILFLSTYKLWRKILVRKEQIETDLTIFEAEIIQDIEVASAIVKAAHSELEKERADMDNSRKALLSEIVKVVNARRRFG